MNRKSRSTLIGENISSSGRSHISLPVPLAVGTMYPTWILGPPGLKLHWPPIGKHLELHQYQLQLLQQAPPDATTPDGAAIDALPPFGIAGATLAVDAFAAPAPQNLNVSDGDKIGGGHEVAPRRFPETWSWSAPLLAATELNKLNISNMMVFQPRFENHSMNKTSLVGGWCWQR